MADALEALTGAIYLDGGLGAVKKVLEPFIEQATQGVESGWELKDPKSRLQEALSKRFGTLPKYDVTEDKEGFVATVVFCGRRLGTAKGPTKRAAQQAAAKKVLDLLHSGNLTWDSLCD